MKKSNGEMVKEPEEILEVLAWHWEELGKSRPAEGMAAEEEGESPDVGSISILT